VQPPGRTDTGTVVIATLLLILGAAALWESREFSALGSIFPRTIGIVLLIACMITLWRTLRGRTRPSRGLFPDGWVRGVLLMAVMSLWIALLEPVGFVVAGVVAYVLLALITEREPMTLWRFLRFVLVAAAFVIAFQVIFVHGLNVQLPTGTLFVSRA